MRPSVFITATLALVLAGSVAQAAPITVSNTINWDDSTNVHGTTYSTFTEPNLPDWTHNLLFDPAAASITSATIELSHAGNRDAAVEMWFLFDSGATVSIGQLSGSSDSVNSNFLTDIFTVPASLFPLLPAGSWSLALKLTESATGTINTIFLDFSKLTVTYEPVVSGPPTPSVPEPAALLLMGMALAGAGYRLRKRR